MIPCISCFLSSSWLQLVNLLSITMLVVVTIMGNNNVMGFSPSLLSSSYSINTLPNSRRLSISIIPSSSALLTSFQCHNRLCARISNYDDDDDDDDDNEKEEDPEFARVRRNRGRRRTYDDDVDDDDMYEYSVESRSRRKSSSVMDAADVLEGEGYFDEFDDDEYDDEDEDEAYDMFSNTLIPNPILDSIDPDGSAERFPELASDPRFWLDMFLFISFLNILSFIGPRNPFPELIPAMYTAGLPPPGM